MSNKDPSTSEHYSSNRYATNTTYSESGHSGSLSAQAQPSTSAPRSEMSNTPTITTRETVERLAQKRVADSLAEH